MKVRLTRFLSAVFICLITFLAIAPTPAHAFSEEQRLVNEVWRIVDRAYVDDTFNHQNWSQVRRDVLRSSITSLDDAYDAIDEMLSVLDDPFTRFLRPDQYKSLQTSTSGELTGVGLQITRLPDTKMLSVISPIEGAPADLAGIQPKDVITKIDGVLTSTFSLDEAAERMRGTPGSHVVLTVSHDSGPEQDFDIVRDRITLNPVSFSRKHISDGLEVGYVRLNQFNANATGAIAQAIDELESQGINGYVLDLRNNPGGLLQAGIEIAKLWLTESVIVHTVDRYGIQETVDTYTQARTVLPLVVLVNSGTASASEILSGALQDNHRAVIVGQRTFGKGLIQSLFNLSNGAGLAVTVARYETPNHTDINTLGIEPDIVVDPGLISFSAIATPDDPQYAKAIEVLENKVMTAAEAMPCHSDRCCTNRMEENNTSHMGRFFKSISLNQPV
jgi:carboxyl-terminal processing protease